MSCLLVTEFVITQSRAFLTTHDIDKVLMLYRRGKKLHYILKIGHSIFAIEVLKVRKHANLYFHFICDDCQGIKSHIIFKDT